MTESIAKSETVDTEEIGVNLDVPKRLWLRAKATAVLQDKPLKQYVAEALEEFNTKHKE